MGTAHKNCRFWLSVGSYEMYKLFGIYYTKNIPSGSTKVSFAIQFEIFKRYLLMAFSSCMNVKRP